MGCQNVEGERSFGLTYTLGSLTTRRQLESSAIKKTFRLHIQLSNLLMPVRIIQVLKTSIILIKVKELKNSMSNYGPNLCQVKMMP